MDGPLNVKSHNNLSIKQTKEIITDVRVYIGGQT